MLKELLGLLPCHGRNQAALALKQFDITVQPRLVDQVLEESLYPTGSWLATVVNTKHIQQLPRQHAIERDNVKFTLRKVFNPESYRVASKFQIDDSTILLYDVPAVAGGEEVHYVFEDYALGKRGIRKVSNSVVDESNTTSFLVHFDTRIEAEKAMLELNASTFAGSELHMFLYN